MHTTSLVARFYLFTSMLGDPSRQNQTTRLLLPCCLLPSSSTTTMGAAASNQRKTPREIYKESKRGIRRARRKLQREKRKLERTEKKMIKTIKKEAKRGRMYAVKLMAKDLVSVRSQIRQFSTMDASMNSMSMKLTMQNASNSMGKMLKTSARTMRQLNRMQNIPAMQRIMQQFEKEQFMTDFMQEQMGDALDQMDVEAEEETDAVVAGVLAEIGLANTVGLGQSVNFFFFFNF